MPDLIVPLDSLHNLKIYFDVSLFPMTAIFKVYFHQQGSISSPSKCEEKLPAICVRTHLGTNMFLCRLSGAGMPTSGTDPEYRVLCSLCCESLTGSLAKRLLCPLCIIFTNGFWYLPPKH